MINAVQIFPPFIRGAIERKDITVLLATRQRLQEILLTINDKHKPSCIYDVTLRSSEDSEHTVTKELEVVKMAINMVMEQAHTLQ